VEQDSIFSNSKRFFLAGSGDTYLNSLYEFFSFWYLANGVPFLSRFERENLFTGFASY